MRFVRLLILTPLLLLTLGAAPARPGLSDAEYKARAAELGLEGAAFPWRTIRGQECSAYWPAGTAAWHINADIAMAFERYRIVTGDDDLEADCGLQVLVETARLWLSLGHHDRHGVWHLDGVTGPDEYTAIVRDNVFTNLMAAHNLHVAADACSRHPEAAKALGVTTEETAAWRDAADAANIPYDDGLEVHQQCEGFTTYAEWDFQENHAYPLLLHDPYVRLYPAQVIKQADLVLAMHWQSHAFTPEEKARNVDYYEPRMVRDSSLSACTQAVMCAEVGHLELAHDYAYEAALIDLRDLHHNTRDGLHMASLAGAWTALVSGFGGLRDDEGFLSLDPQLPDGISRLRFRLRWRDFRVTVDVNHADVTYTLRDGPGGELKIRHAGEELELSTESATTVAVRSFTTAPGSAANRTNATLLVPAAAAARSRNRSALYRPSSPTLRLSSRTNTTYCSFAGLSHVSPQSAPTRSTMTRVRAASEATRCHREKSVSPR